MTMTSKERVMTAFAFEEPDHVPVWMGASPEFRAHDAGASGPAG